MRKVFFNSLPQHDVLFSHFVSNFNVYSKRQSIWYSRSISHYIDAAPIFHQNRLKYHINVHDDVSNLQYVLYVHLA